MTCQDAVALLSDYLEMALGAETLADLDRHLGGARRAWPLSTPSGSRVA